MQSIVYGYKQVESVDKKLDYQQRTMYYTQMFSGRNVSLMLAEYRKSSAATHITDNIYQHFRNRTKILHVKIFQWDQRCWKRINDSWFELRGTWTRFIFFLKNGKCRSTLIYSLINWCNKQIYTIKERLLHSVWEELDIETTITSDLIYCKPCKLPCRKSNNMPW